MKPKTYYGLREAAKIAGISINTIRDKINNGHISCAERSEKGYRIDASEFHRVFPDAQVPDTDNTVSDTPQEIQTDTEKDTRIKLLQLELYQV